MKKYDYTKYNDKKTNKILNLEKLVIESGYAEGGDTQKELNRSYCAVIETLYDKYDEYNNELFNQANKMYRRILQKYLRMNAAVFDDTEFYERV